MQGFRDVVPLVIAGLALIIYLSWAPGTRSVATAWSSKLDPIALLMPLVLGALLGLVGRWIVRRLRLQRLSGVGYVLLMDFLDLVGLASLVSLACPGFLSVAIAALLALGLHSAKGSPRIPRNVVVLLEALALAGVFLPLGSSLTSYAVLLVLLGLWDWLSVEFLGFMQRLASRLLAQGYPACYRLSLLRGHRVCLGNGDLALILVFPGVLELQGFGILGSILGFLLELTLAYIFIYIIYCKVREPQPFVPYLDLVQASALWLLLVLLG